MLNGNMHPQMRSCFMTDWETPALSHACCPQQIATRLAGYEAKRAFRHRPKKNAWYNWDAEDSPRERDAAGLLRPRVFPAAPRRQQDGQKPIECRCLIGTHNEHNLAPTDLTELNGDDLRRDPLEVRKAT
jgi:hypothetical protein